jgi:hypothetical protein
VFSLIVTDQVSHSYKSTGKINKNDLGKIKVLGVCILMFVFLDGSRKASEPSGCKHQSQKPTRLNMNCMGEVRKTYQALNLGGGGDHLPYR